VEQPFSSSETLKLNSVMAIQRANIFYVVDSTGFRANVANGRFLTYLLTYYLLGLVA